MLGDEFGTACFSGVNVRQLRAVLDLHSELIGVPQAVAHKPSDSRL
jgi:hypothetical protein